MKTPTIILAAVMLCAALSAATAYAFTGNTTTAPSSGTNCPYEHFPPVPGGGVISYACAGLMLALLLVFIWRGRKSPLRIGGTLAIVGVVAFVLSFIGPMAHIDGPDPSYYIAKEAIAAQCGGDAQLTVVAKYDGDDMYTFVGDKCVEPMRMMVSKTHEVYGMEVSKYAGRQPFSQSDWKISGAQAWALARADMAIFGTYSGTTKFLAMLLTKRGDRLEWRIDFETMDRKTFEVRIDAATGEKLGSAHFASCA